MKRNTEYYKFPLFEILSLLSVVLFLSSCVKSRVGRTDFGSLQPVVLIPEGGLNAFSSQALVFPATDASDTASFYVNFASSNVALTDETITIGVDQNAIASYNSANGTNYQLFPDSIFSFSSTQVVVKKGNNYTNAIPFVVFPSKVDPTQSYMYPITIKAVPTGSTISGNFGTIYYHLIGNPIAGAYTREWIRYNNTAGTGSPAFDQISSVLLSPVDNTTASVKSGTGVIYLVTFTNTGGVLSNFQVSLDAGSVKTAGITITGGPTVVSADPVAGKYVFNFTYNNSSGSGRNITDKFTKQ